MTFILTPEGLALFPAFLLATLLAILLPKQSAAPAAGYFRGFLVFGAMFIAALMVELVTEEPLRRYATVVQYVVIVITLALCTQFAYRFSARPWPREPVLVGACYGLALAALTIGLITYLRRDNERDTSLQWMNLVVLAAFIWPVVVFVRQMLRTRPWMSSHHRFGLPAHPDARTSLSFALALLFPVVLCVALVAYELRLIQRFTFHALNSAGILFFVALLTQVFLGWHRRVAPGTRLLISPKNLSLLALILALCGVANLPLITEYRRAYAFDRKIDTAETVALLLTSESPERVRLPESVAFVITLYPLATLYSRVDPVPARLILRDVVAGEEHRIDTDGLMTQITTPALDRDMARLLARRSISRDANFLDGNLSLGTLFMGKLAPQYHYLSLQTSDQHYLVGFSYESYRAYVNRLIGVQALVVLSISLVATGFIVGRSLARRTCQES